MHEVFLTQYTFKQQVYMLVGGVLYLEHLFVIIYPDDNYHTCLESRSESANYSPWVKCAHVYFYK